MSVRVCPQPNGDVLVARSVPTGLDAAPVVRLRFPASEWAEFVEGVRNGGFDSTVLTASPVSRDRSASPSHQGCRENAAAGQLDGKAGPAATTLTTDLRPQRRTT
jgi:hypothetical protein